MRAVLRDDHPPEEANEKENKHDATGHDRNHVTAHGEDTEASHYGLQRIQNNNGLPGGKAKRRKNVMNMPVVRAKDRPAKEPSARDGEQRVERRDRQNQTYRNECRNRGSGHTEPARDRTENDAEKHASRVPHEDLSGGEVVDQEPEADT